MNGMPSFSATQACLAGTAHGGGRRNVMEIEGGERTSQTEKKECRKENMAWLPVAQRKLVQKGRGLNEAR